MISAAKAGAMLAFLAGFGPAKAAVLTAFDQVVTITEDHELVYGGTAIAAGSQIGIANFDSTLGTLDSVQVTAQPLQSSSVNVTIHSNKLSPETGYYDVAIEPLFSEYLDDGSQIPSSQQGSLTLLPNQSLSFTLPLSTEVVTGSASDPVVFGELTNEGTIYTNTTLVGSISGDIAMSYISFDPLSFQETIQYVYTPVEVSEPPFGGFLLGMGFLGTILYRLRRK